MVAVTFIQSRALYGGVFLNNLIARRRSGTTSHTSGGCLRNVGGNHKQDEKNGRLCRTRITIRRQTRNRLDNTDATSFAGRSGTERAGEFQKPLLRRHLPSCRRARRRCWSRR